MQGRRLVCESIENICGSDHWSALARVGDFKVALSFRFFVVR